MKIESANPDAPYNDFIRSNKGDEYGHIIKIFSTGQEVNEGTILTDLKK